MPVGLLEYSEDPLSDASPTYVDVTSYLFGPVSWSDGKTRDLDEPQAGSMSFRLKQPNREWEPEYPGAVFDAKPLRRFRWSVDGTPEGIWYAVSWKVEWPAGTAYSTVDVTCVDGFELLSLDLLDLLDPPTASSYEEVVMQDQPYGYYLLAETAGTAVIPVTGTEGQYRNTPLLGQRVIAVDSPVLGENLPYVRFRSAQSEFARIPLANADAFADTNAITAECNFLPAAVGVTHLLMSGPFVTAISETTWTLRIDSGSNTYQAVLRWTDGTSWTLVSTTLANTGNWRHVCLTWDGFRAALSIDGTEEFALSGERTLRTGNANDYLYIGGNNNISQYADGYMGHAAFYEHGLTEDRVSAHGLAARQRGFGVWGTPGQRIGALAASALWDETPIQTGEHVVAGVMEHGQSKLDEIKAAVRAEMPESLFYFNGDGDPVYLGWNYKDGLAPLATFGAGPGEIKYQAIAPVYDDEIFNDVTVGHESAPGQETQHNATDEDSIAAYYRRAHAETGLILTDHHDAIAVAEAILERHHEPMQRFASLTVNSANPFALTQILDRQIGDLIRIKGLSASGTPIDVVTTILGRAKTLDTNGHMVCTWNCARGFNAAAGVWQLGIDGFSELGETTVLA